MESCDSISTDETSSSSFSSAKSINYLSSSSSSKPTESSSSLLSISPKPTITKTTSNKRKTFVLFIVQAAVTLIKELTASHDKTNKRERAHL
ncbi:unnamed protein product [Rotaria sp. Silwood2]|nr:unnamed protein product [Rotaria sp. Silwood2]